MGSKVTASGYSQLFTGMQPKAKSNEMAALKAKQKKKKPAATSKPVNGAATGNTSLYV